jgi:Arc/MetJ family transcription regulator
MRTTIEIDGDLLEDAVDEAARRRLAALRGKLPEIEVASRRRL